MQGPSRIPNPEDNLDAMERLLLGATSGIHVLFLNKEIRYLAKMPWPKGPNDEQVRQLEDQLMTQLVHRPHLREKREFWQSLEPSLQKILFQAYWDIVEEALKIGHPHWNQH